MKSLVLILFVAFASAKPAPGGYTASGGVFNPDRHLDYMNEARHAGAGETRVTRTVEVDHFGNWQTDPQDYLARRKCKDTS